VRLVNEAPKVAAYRARLAIAMACYPRTAKQAEREFVEAVRLEPDNADLHYQFGLYYKAMRPARAIGGRAAHVGAPQSPPPSGPAGARGPVAQGQRAHLAQEAIQVTPRVAARSATTRLHAVATASVDRRGVVQQNHVGRERRDEDEEYELRSPALRAAESLAEGLRRAGGAASGSRMESYDGLR